MAWTYHNQQLLELPLEFLYLSFVCYRPGGSCPQLIRLKLNLRGSGAYPLKTLKFRFPEMQFGAFLESDLRKNEPKVTMKI